MQRSDPTAAGVHGRTRVADQKKYPGRFLRSLVYPYPHSLMMS